MIRPASYTVFYRPVNASLIRRFADHTYVRAITGPPEQTYYFTCYDKTSTVGQLGNHNIALVKPDVSAGEQDLYDALNSCVMANANNFDINSNKTFYNSADDKCNITYMLHGVCHQMANRFIYHTGFSINPNLVKGMRLSNLIFGSHGKYYSNYLATVTNRINEITAIYNPPVQDDWDFIGYQNSANSAEKYDTDIQSIYELHLNNACSDLERILIKLSFATESEQTRISRFDAFMDDSFHRLYNGKYELIDSDITINKLLKSYMTFWEQKDRADSEEIRQSKGSVCPSPEYIKLCDNIIQKMLDEFYNELKSKLFIKLFGMKYEPAFSFMPEEWMD